MNKTDNPALSVSARKKTYFDFEQKIQATIAASVGDKMKFNMTYNTDATFEFDNKNLKLAYEGKGSFRAGSHCRFCKVKETCRTRAEHNMELLKYEFKEPPLLSNEEIADILKAAEHLSSWASDVKDYALSEALTGVKYPGFKVVAGKANRKFTDEEAVASTLLEAGYDPYAKKLLSITALSRKLGQKTFEELLGSYITKPKGSPVLVEDSDKRPDYFLAAEEFKENNDDKEEN